MQLETCAGQNNKRHCLSCLFLQCRLVPSLTLAIFKLRKGWCHRWCLELNTSPATTSHPITSLLWLARWHLLMWTHVSACCFVIRQLSLFFPTGNPSCGGSIHIWSKIYPRPIKACRSFWISLWNVIFSASNVMFAFSNPMIFWPQNWWVPWFNHWCFVSWVSNATTGKSGNQ